MGAIENAIAQAVQGISLRWYQQGAIADTFQYFMDGGKGNPVIALPTGTGKSLVIGGFAAVAFHMFGNQRIMCATHREQLVGQNAIRFRRIAPHVSTGVYCAGLNRRDTRQQCLFVAIDSVQNRAEEFGPIDLLFIDEAHLVDDNPKSRYQKFINGLHKQNATKYADGVSRLKVVGLSATPWRPGMGWLWQGNTFTDCSYNAIDMDSWLRMMDDGVLMPLIPKRTTGELDVTGVRTTAGEFNAGDLELAVDQDDITASALQEAVEAGNDPQDTRHCWMAFGVSVKHCENICRILNELGVAATISHSKMPKEQAAANEQAFMQGKYRCIVNMGKLTTGFDHPPVDMIIMLRPTKSSSLWVQMLGRGARPYNPERPGDVNPQAYPDKKHNCLVLDFARNVLRNGPVNDPVIPKPKGSKGGNPPPMKVCPTCGMYHAGAVRFCGGKPKDDPDFDPARGCGHEFVFDVKIKARAGTDDIIVNGKAATPVEVFKVDLVTYSIHRKEGKPDSLRVAYSCGRRVFNEYVCVEHDGFARVKANKWWQQRCGQPAPAMASEALQASHALKAPSHIRVELDKRYPSVMASDFTGTAFGAEGIDLSKPAGQYEQPQVAVEADTSVLLGKVGSGGKPPAPPQEYSEPYDDDVPF